MSLYDNEKLDINDTPLLVIDMDVAEKNCRKMARNLNEHKISWRPHIKTHKSTYFAKKQIEWGAEGITCSSVGEARVMAEAGISDIFIAYPIVGKAKLGRLYSLCEKTPCISCLVNDLEAAKQVSDFFSAQGKNARVLVEIDGRMGRGGVTREKLPMFVDTVLQMKGVDVLGVASFCGNAGKLAAEKERREDACIEAENLLAAREILISNGIKDPVVSGGSSVSSRYPDCLEGITESRAGTCIFNDMSHVALGTCNLSECAAYVRTTVISIPYKGRFVLDAGSKTLSSDLCRNAGYGYIVELGQNAIIETLNEEHGMCNSKCEVTIGDVLKIIPNHVCTAINLQNSLIGYKNGEYFEIPIEARGISK